MNSEWIDISVPLRDGMVHWPGDPDVRIYRVSDIDKGDVANLSKLDMSAHTGTHMDGPLHFTKDGISLDQMPLSATIGPARVIEIQDTESIKPEALIPYDIKRGERILFKTDNSTRDWLNGPFIEDFVYISTEAANFLTEHGVKTVGVDYLSVSGYNKNEVEVHQTLLQAGIWIIEGLQLAQVEPGSYGLICLPIKILNSDGAPARAILRPL
ncbi:cyclase family protein [candidate division KSB1 bacterium]|nr:cyclase family protein [candidate division KSB1 bacterium]